MPKRSVHFVTLDFQPDARTIGQLGPRAMHSAPQLALALRMGGALREAGAEGWGLGGLAPCLGRQPARMVLCAWLLAATGGAGVDKRNPWKLSNLMMTWFTI